MANLDDVYAIALAFLDASVAALELTVGGSPDRAYVSPGQPALDCCDQLTVHTQILGEAPLSGGAGALAGAKRINRGGLAQVTIAIQITRCVPLPTEANGIVTLPAAADLQTAAQTIDEDGWALWIGLNYALKHGTLAEVCGGAERLGGEKLIPQGGCGGWIFQYRYPIEGGQLGT